MIRLAACCLAIGGIISGFEASTPARPDLLVDGYIVLAGDFHVHSFPGDGALAPWDLAREARRRGLDVVALTNHNHLLSWRVARLVPWDIGGAILIPGEELTSAGYHMAAVGITATLPWRQPAARAAAAIRAAGGVSIAAHPVGDGTIGLDDAALDAVDGFESAHPVMYVSETRRRELEQFRTRITARRPAIASIGSTDFHFFAPVGFCRTFLFVKQRSTDGILDAIRAGRTVACDADGRVYGRPDLANAVADACARAAGSPAIGATRRERFASFALWLGLVGLVVMGANEAHRQPA